MSSSLIINSVTGTPPYDVYVCTTLGTGCVLVGSGITVVPFALTLPAIFDEAPAILVKIVDAFQCTFSEIKTCV
jgi:hypothetical protein